MLHLIFYKTAKGRDELATRQHKLGVRHRQALILLDGTKAGAALSKVFGDDATAKRILNELRTGGFITENKRIAESEHIPASSAIDSVINIRAVEPVSTAPQVDPVRVGGNSPVDHEITQEADGVEVIVIRPPEAEPAADIAVDRVKVESARIIMLDTTERCLGLMGAELKKKIAAADNSDSLRAVIPRWHMALRESRRGQGDAQRYLETVVAALG